MLWWLQLRPILLLTLTQSLHSDRCTQVHIHTCNHRGHFAHPFSLLFSHDFPPGSLVEVTWNYIFFPWPGLVIGSYLLVASWELAHCCSPTLYTQEPVVPSMFYHMKIMCSPWLLMKIGADSFLEDLHAQTHTHTLFSPTLCAFLSWKLMNYEVGQNLLDWTPCSPAPSVYLSPISHQFSPRCFGFEVKGKKLQLDNRLSAFNSSTLSLRSMAPSLFSLSALLRCWLLKLWFLGSHLIVSFSVS